MRWLLQLYPAAWRERYGDEFAAVLAGQRASIGLVVDVLGGAADAWLHPQFERQKISQGEQTMTNEMIQRCAMGGPKLSRREQLWAGIFLALGMILFAAVYVVLRKIYHARPAVEALNYMSLPGIYLLYLQLTYLRKHSAATQAIIVIGTLTSLYLIMWGACSVAMRF